MFSAAVGGFNYTNTITTTGHWLVNTTAPYLGPIVADSTNSNIITSGEGENMNFSNIGQVTWQKSFSAGTSFNATDIALDSSLNSYILGSYSGANSDIYLQKYDSTGALTWQVKVASAYNDYGHNIALDTSGNVWITGQYSTSSTIKASTLVEYTSSGTFSNAYQITTVNNSSINGIQFDSSNNMYLLWQANASTATLCYVTKFNSSLVHQWTTTITVSTNTSLGQLKLDSSNNVYVIYTDGSSTPKLIKLNSSGTFQWGINLNATFRGWDYAYMDLDSSGNIYVGG
jgi:hypothetical protein